MFRKFLTIFLATSIFGLTLAEESNEVYPFKDKIYEERFLIEDTDV